ncbi:MAG: hypothetical protein ACYCVZ_03120 [Streptosporangiaceae bacterium]
MKTLASCLRAAPAGRPGSPPGEIAEAILFLATGPIELLDGAIVPADEGHIAV